MFTEYFYFMLNRKWIARYGVTRKGIRQRRWIFVVQRYFAWTHCYRNANLFRLENLCCLGFPTGNARPGQKGESFCPGSANRDKRISFVPFGVTNRDKRPSFVPVGRPGTKGHPLLFRSGVPGWETGTTSVSQPSQISVSVVVHLITIKCAFFKYMLNL